MGLIFLHTRHKTFYNLFWQGWCYSCFIYQLFLCSHCWWIFIVFRGSFSVLLRVDFLKSGNLKINFQNLRTVWSRENLGARGSREVIVPSFLSWPLREDASFSADMFCVYVNQPIFLGNKIWWIIFKFQMKCFYKVILLMSDL